ncbi:MAG: hypothetical protein A370_04132, partial [Clostridium sp. Maddingley MBC34-26]
ASVRPEPGSNSQYKVKLNLDEVYLQLNVS